MKFTKAVLPNGLVVLNEYRDFPVTTVAIASRLGAATETVQEKGISHLLEHMCFKGTSRRNSKMISSEIEKVGGDLNAFTSNDMTGYHAKLPSKHALLALDVLTDMYFNSIFPEKELVKESKVVCEEIKRKKDSPVAHTVSQVLHNLYEFPFGLGVLGTEESVLSFKRENLLEKHARNYFPSNSIISVVGNTSLDEVIDYLGSFSFPLNSVSSDIQSVNKRFLSTSEIREGLQQATLAMGFSFPNSSSKESYSAQIFNAFLGEGMSSRLFQEVREKLGLAYSVGSFYFSGRNFGSLITHAGMDKKNCQQVMDIMLKEIRNVGNLSVQDFEDTKRKIVGNYLITLEDSGRCARELIDEEMGRGAENFYDYERNIQAVKLDDVRALADVNDYASFVLSPK